MTVYVKTLESELKMKLKIIKVDNQSEHEGNVSSYFYLGLVVTPLHAWPGHPQDFL
jgi:hypothetical protein